MKSFGTHFVFLGILVMLAACAQVDDDTQAGPSRTYIRLSPSAPPQRPLEVKPFASKPLEQVWRQGYWNYDGANFKWVEGRYMDKPDPTAAWMGDRWEKRTFGWAFVPGYWY